MKQSYQNHWRWDPPYHYFVTPAVVLNFVLVVWGGFGWWTVVMAAVFALMTRPLRNYCLFVQDRLIRLEERLRLMELDPSLRDVELTRLQWTGIRFASDEELPGLVRRAAAEKLSLDEIKRSIRVWREDHFRV